MADNDQNNDEYKFVELDGPDNDTMGDGGSDSNTSAKSYNQNTAPKKDIKRNAIVAIVIIVFIMVMYKLIGYLFFASNDQQVAIKKTPTPITEVAPQPQPTEISPVPVQSMQPMQPVIAVDTSDLTKKVAAIEIAQQNVRSEVSSVSQQVGTVNNNVNNLNTQINNLNQVITNLSNQLAKQSEEINTLMARSQPKRVMKPIVKVYTKPLIYYIQAVIPGRAWLIATNGSTLTVREGSKINGYGVVQLIDSLQGRVITSSGQVIRFSQEDS